MQKSLVIVTSTVTRVALVLMLAVSIVGCSSHNFSVKRSDTLTENSQNFRVDLDSISRSLFQKDSVYIGKSHWMEYHPQLVVNVDTTGICRVDTVVIRDSVTVYRLRHVRDSARVIERDTIPVVQRVEVVKEVPRSRNWFDWMCYSVTGLVMLVLVAYIVKRLLPL